MTRWIALPILTGLSLALAGPPQQAPPPKLLDIYRPDSDPAIPPPPSGFFRTIFSFTFSPDEKWIAVTLQARAMKGRLTPVQNTFLLLPLHPADGLRVEIDPGTGGSVLWSPDSETVVVQENLGKEYGAPKIYNLRGELVWTGPQSGALLGFIAPGRLLARHAKAKGRSAGFDTIDIRTSAITPTPWSAPRHWAFRAIDSERGLLAVFPNFESSKTLIVDYATGKVVQSVKNQNQNTLVVYRGGPDWVYFAENGKTLCDVAMLGSFKTYPVCRDVDTGKTIAEFRGLDGGQPASASTRGSRLVLSNLNYLAAGSFRGKSRPEAESYSDRIVWDFRAGTEVAAWRPSTAQTAWLRRASAGVNLLAPVAISPLGNYVAEVVGDELHIYEIP